MDRGKSKQRALVFLFLCLLIPFLHRFRLGSGHQHNKFNKLFLMGGLSLLLLWQGVLFLDYFKTPMGIDVPWVTLKAANLIRSGHSFYRESIDPYPDLKADGYSFDGFKYSPLMPFFYLTFEPFGQKGVRITNLALNVLVAFLVFTLTSRMIDPFHGGVSLLLYFSWPLIPCEIFKQGFTDLSAVCLVLMSALFVPTRSIWSGFFLGLSISTKQLPGALFVPLFLPAYNRRDYVFGLCAGLLPMLLFFIVDGRYFYSNVFLFNFYRPIFPSSWLYGLPVLLPKLLKWIFLGGMAGVTLHVYLNKPSLIKRFGLGVICLLGAQLCGPLANRNYQLWWLPFFAILMARWSSCEWRMRE